MWRFFPIRWKPRALASIVAAILLLCVLRVPASAQDVGSTAASKALHELFAGEWDYLMEQHPTWASTLGDRRWNDRWSDVSLDAIFRRHSHNVELLAKLGRIERSVLSPADQLNYDLFQRDYRNEVDGFQFHGYLLPINQLGGVHTVNELSNALRFETVKDYEDWLARLNSLPVRIEQTIALMRQGIKERIILPKVVMARIPAQLDAQIVSDPQASPLYKPFMQFTPSIAPAEQSRLAQSAREAIANVVVPAYQKLKEFFIRDYLPAASDQVGIWQLPRGAAMYAHAVRRETTTDLTAQQIHELGLSEVRRIRGEMAKLIEQIGFKGTFTEFAAYLRREPKFYFQSETELLDAYRALSRRIDPALVKVFRTLPRTPYGIEPVPENLAPASPAGFYRGPAADGSRAGTVQLNTYQPQLRPKYEMIALLLHEGVPGHHLQIALAMEQQEIPKFRRYGGYTAFVEGWGLYAESLGDEMGLYDDPYSKFGQLMYEIWRASRLVVDTGLHQLRWDRQKAIDYMIENTVKQEQEIIVEVDRYIVWPGQALAYKVGQLKIAELRAKAKQTLGDKFDIRDFHDELLKDGPLPLQQLEIKLNRWLDQQKLAGPGK